MSYKVRTLVVTPVDSWWSPWSEWSYEFEVTEEEHKRRVRIIRDKLNSEGRDFAVFLGESFSEGVDPGSADGIIGEKKRHALSQENDGS